jgi:tetratricopeptide (TPR) repeat protein
MRPLLFPAGLLLALSAPSCSPDGAPTSTAPPATSPNITAAPIASTAPPRAASASALVSIADAGGGDGGRPRLDPAQRAAVLRDLEAGRKLARAKDWSGALVVFNRALALAPDDARLLAEVGWAAFQAKDFARADAANQRALAVTKNPSLRAQVLYNAGRVAEARGEKEAAKNDYADSLALRDNAEVKKRLVAVGGVADDTRAPLPCAKGYASAEAMCACFSARKDDLMMSGDGAPKCAANKPAPALGDARLAVYLWGNEGLGERVYVLTVREGATIRPLVDLGRDYEPGAFGVHNEATVKGGEARTVGGHKVVVVRSEQEDSDLNMAGLEVCSHHAKNETVCALGDTPGATRCTPSIPIEVEAGCGPGADPGPSETDPEVLAAVAEIKKNTTHAQAKTAWSIGENGKVTVRLVSGAKDLVPTSVLRDHALW